MYTHFYIYFNSIQTYAIAKTLTSLLDPGYTEGKSRVTRAEVLVPGHEEKKKKKKKGAI